MDLNIVILTGNHLCNNPRVIKEGTTLANAGYAVTAIGAWFDRDLKARDLEMQRSLPFSFKPAVDGTENASRRLRLRASAKMGSIAHRLARFENRSQLGYAYSALRAASRQPASLYIAHSEAAMAVATDLLHDGCLVGIDVEDWFSEDLPLEARKHRPVRLLRNLERKLLTLGGYSACPSRAMSEALAREFGCPQPTVVYNAFPWSDRESVDGLFKDRRDRRLPSIHHHIGPDIDAERDRIVAELKKAGLVEQVYWVDHFHQQLQGKNGGGDPWHTDGRLEVAILVMHTNAPPVATNSSGSR